jgi:glycosyltransferase involved in cell wall biosynthesis
MENKLIILICHYNNPKGLEASIMSIKENFNVDILIVDDGSKDKPDLKDLKEKYQGGNIFLEFLSQNMGVGIATNHGLIKILEKDYHFTGRLDCGDLNHPNKYSKQIAYLKKNPSIKLLGTYVNMVDPKGKLLFVLKHPITHNEIVTKMFLNSTFVNSSVIYYTEILKQVGLFPEKYHRNGEDYAFFFNVIEKFNVENLPEVLLDYVVDPNSLSSTRRNEQVLARINIIKEHFHFGFYPIYGLLRNYILFLLPRNFTTFAKKIIYKN